MKQRFCQAFLCQFRLLCRHGTHIAAAFSASLQFSFSTSCGSVGEINTGDAHPGASFALRYTKPSVSYNASTGVVTVSGNVATATNSVHYTSYNRSVTSVCKVYLSVGQIKNI